MNARVRWTPTWPAPGMGQVIGLYVVLALFVGIPALVYLSDRRRRARTQAELEDEAMRSARDHQVRPGDDLRVTPPPGPFN